MTQTYKERVEQAFRDEVPLSPRELRDLAAEADAQLASKDAEIAQVYAAAGEAQAERDAARDERDALAAEVARLRLECASMRDKLDSIYREQAARKKG